jgi:hypothetical protein
MALTGWYDEWIDTMVTNRMAKHDAENASHALYRNNIFNLP